jgi:hypothetical protein
MRFARRVGELKLGRLPVTRKKPGASLFPVASSHPGTPDCWDLYSRGGVTAQVTWRPA